MAQIKFRPNGFVEIRDNDGREVILHTKDIVKIVENFLNLVQDMQYIKAKLSGMFEGEE